MHIWHIILYNGIEHTMYLNDMMAISLGVVVNGLVVGKVDYGTTPGTKKPRTYFGQIAIMRGALNVTVTPDQIKVNGRALKWRTSRYSAPGGARIAVTSKRNVTVDLGRGLVFTVLNHKVHKPHPTKVDYLGFYIEDGSKLSRQTHGLIGKYIQTNNLILKPTLLIVWILVTQWRRKGGAGGHDPS